jgi:hypothetical protein
MIRLRCLNVARARGRLQPRATPYLRRLRIVKSQTAVVTAIQRGDEPRPTHWEEIAVTSGAGSQAPYDECAPHRKDGQEEERVDEILRQLWKDGECDRKPREQAEEGDHPPTANGAQASGNPLGRGGDSSGDRSKERQTSLQTDRGPCRTDHETWEGEFRGTCDGADDVRKPEHGTGSRSPAGQRLLPSHLHLQCGLRISGPPRSAGGPRRVLATEIAPQSQPKPGQAGRCMRCLDLTPQPLGFPTLPSSPLKRPAERSDLPVNQVLDASCERRTEE